MILSTNSVYLENSRKKEVPYMTTLEILDRLQCDLPKYYKGLDNKSLLKETNIPNQLHQYKKKLRKEQVQRMMAIIDPVSAK